MSYGYKCEQVEIYFELLDETDLAYFVTDGTVDVWLPKEAATPVDGCEIGETAVFQVTEDIAIEKGLV